MDKNKELVIRMDEAEKELVAAMNGIMQKHNLPCFILEPILDKIHRQVINGKNAELEQARMAEAIKADAKGRNDCEGGV